MPPVFKILVSINAGKSLVECGSVDFSASKYLYMHLVELTKT